MNVRPSLVADEQALEVVEMGKRLVDDPAHPSQPGSVLGLAAGDQGRDAQLAQFIAVAVGVVAAVSNDTRGATARMANPARHRRHGLDKREQLLDVVSVGAGQAPGERDARGIDENVLLGAGTAPVDRARARFEAPFFA